MRAFVFAAFAAVAVGMGIWWQVSTRHEVFFAEALREASAQETVVVAGRAYEVTNGDVSSLDRGAVSASERRAALTLAYALTLARRDPIFGLAGTDPDALEARVNDLASSLESLAERQTSPEDTAAAPALYPIDFLREVARLERARIAFLASRSHEDMTAYRGQLDATLDAYISGADAFATTVATVLPERPGRILTFAGTMTTDAVPRMASELHEKGMRLSEKKEREDRCLSGSVHACDTARLAKSLFSDESSPAQELPTDIHEIESIYAEILGPQETRRFVSLSTTCLPDGDTQYLIAPTERYQSVLAYARDFFFAETGSSTGPTIQYLEESGITRASLNPFNYYLCPDIQHDNGRVYAILKAYDFALAHDSLLPEARGALINAPAMSEQAVATYLAAAHDAARADERNEVAELALMFEKRSAGLEYLLGSIVRILDNQLRLDGENVPIDLSIQTRFASHHALPSLFFAHTNDDRIQAYRPHTVLEKNEFMQYAQSYMAQRDSIPREELIRDIRAFLVFEGRLEK